MLRENCAEKQKLLHIIGSSGFSMYDTALFLDTHPSNREALSYYKEMSSIYNEAVEDYEKKYGPLTIDSADCNKSWEWIENPWPWELEG